jgi:hypothetical protein
MRLPQLLRRLLLRLLLLRLVGAAKAERRLLRALTAPRPARLRPALPRRPRSRRRF